nr:GNAT family N-acetyltransferase [uncultured Dorea sp.]
MNIRQVTDGKEAYIELLREGDADESRIRRVLEEGDLFLLEEHGKIRTICAAIFSEEKRCEIKNIVTHEKDRGKGYGRYMIHYICEHYCGQYEWVYMKKERCEGIMEFCEKCGFVQDDEKYLKKELMSEIDIKRVINLAMEAGRLLLKNGGEIFRVEETMMRICHRFGVKYVDLFTLSHGLFICAGNDKEKLHTRVKQVPLSSTHLGIVAEVNDLSREIAAGNVGIEEAQKKLKEINKMPTKKISYQIIASGLSAGGLGYLLGGTSREALVAVLVGCGVFSWSLFAGRHGISKILVHIVGGIIIAALALVAMQIPLLGPLRMEGIVTGGIMPLVPGLAFVNAIRDLADSDYLAGTVKMIDAIMVFVYIAIGVGAALGFYHSVLGGVL